MIDAAVDHGRPLELPPQPDIDYKAFADIAGGRGDAYTFSIGHRNGEQFVVDVLRGTHPPFDPVEVTKEYATLAKQYRIAEVTRDHYAAEFAGAAWRDCGIRCERSELTKSQIYIECLPLFTRGAARLPDHPRLLRELRELERYTHRSGRDTVSHAKTGSDDYCNAALGVLRLLSVSGPALWRSESFAVRPEAATPLRAGLIFATLVVGEAGAAGVAYFAKSIIPKSPLTILDVDLAPLSPNLLLDMATRLADFAKAMRARGFVIFHAKSSQSRTGTPRCDECRTAEISSWPTICSPSCVGPCVRQPRATVPGGHRRKTIRSPSCMAARRRTIRYPLRYSAAFASASIENRGLKKPKRAA